MTARTRMSSAALLALVALLAVACSSGTTDVVAPDAGTETTDAAETADPAEDGEPAGPEDTIPLSAAVAADGWSEVDPASVGLDSAALEQIAQEAEAAGSHCLVVVRDGQLAGEWTWSETGTTEAQEVFSVTKSITGIVTGIVAADGDLDPEDPAATWIESWAGTPSEDVTVRNLLSNDSGRFWSLASDYGALVSSSDQTGYAVGLEQADEPGSTWAYNNAAIQTLEAVLTAATGTELPDLVAERLLDPLGMADSSLATDADGNGLAFMGLQSTCRDLARFGLMVLDGGRWGDEQVVPADWIETSTGAPSQDLNAAYGLLWWLNAEGPQASSVSPTSAEEAAGQATGQLVPGAPEDLVWALGLGDQVVQVHPGTATVVVRLGPPSGGFGAGQTARVVTEAL